MKYQPQITRPATDLTTTFGRTLAALRHALGLTQPELAEQVPVERTALARFELGRTTVGVPVLLTLERIFLDLNALRRHGDLLLLAAETATRLRRTGALVYADRRCNNWDTDKAVNTIRIHSVDRAFSSGVVIRRSRP